jgi:SAM-dependent methyltransferase
MTERAWNEDYLQGFTPWDTSTPEPTLVDFVRSTGVTSGRALDVGCGTGTHALWLASQGFEVIGVDISPRAIELARARAGDAQTRGAIRFDVLDFLASTPDGGPFDLVFDRGVFHVFDAAEDRSRFAAQVASCLAPGGSWLSLIGSTEGPPREEGPPRRSARDIANAIEPVLEIVELRGSIFDPDRPVPPRAWTCVSRPRSVPAQPSTART